MSFYPTEIFWPLNCYIPSLENQKREAAAQQAEAMWRALSQLTKVDELALSVDSGLGWIDGQDKSDRAKFFQDKVEVFGLRFDKSKAEYAREWFDANEALLSQFTGLEREMLELYSNCIRLSFLANSNLLNIVADFMKTFPRQELTYLYHDEIDDHVRLAMIAAGYLKPYQHVYLWDVKKLIHKLAERLSWIDRVGPREFWWAVGTRGSQFSKFHVPNTQGLFVPIASPGNKEQFERGAKVFAHWTTWPIDHRHLPQTSHNKDTKPEVNGGLVNDPKDDLANPCKRFKGSVNDSNDHAPDTLETLRTFDRDLLLKLFRAKETGEPAMIFNGLDLGASRTTSVNLSRGLIVPCEVFSILVSCIEDEMMVGALKPSKLTLAQRQCLKETGWVHHAFFTSYVSSIIELKANFATVRTFTLAKLSSSYLGYLQNVDFWAALANVTQFTIIVSPEWREPLSGYDGSFPAVDILPSQAATQLYKTLVVLSTNRSIKTLKVGYIGGGEHATGLWARNTHLLPAPVNDDCHSGQILMLPQLENLTLINCWVVPSVLKKFVMSMKVRSLCTLTLISVSLLLYGGRSLVVSELPNENPRGYGVKYELIGLDQMAREIVYPDLPEDGRDTLPIVWRDQHIYEDTWPDFIDATDPTQTLAMKRASD